MRGPNAPWYQNTGYHPAFNAALGGPPYARGSPAALERVTLAAAAVGARSGCTEQVRLLLASRYMGALQRQSPASGPFTPRAPCPALQHRL
jgi:hypothetical protein